MVVLTNALTLVPIRILIGLTLLGVLMGDLEDWMKGPRRAETVKIIPVSKAKSTVSQLAESKRSRNLR